MKTLYLFMHRPVQMKYAAKAAHGSRGEQGKSSRLDCTDPCR